MTPPKSASDACPVRRMVRLHAEECQSLTVTFEAAEKEYRLLVDMFGAEGRRNRQYTVLAFGTPSYELSFRLTERAHYLQCALDEAMQRMQCAAWHLLRTRRLEQHLRCELELAEQCAERRCLLEAENRRMKVAQLEVVASFCTCVANTALAMYKAGERRHTETVFRVLFPEFGPETERGLWLWKAHAGMKQNAASMVDEAEHTNRLCQQLEAGSLRKPPATAHLRGHRVARPCPQN